MATPTSQVGRVFTDVIGDYQASTAPVKQVGRVFVDVIAAAPGFAWPPEPVVPQQMLIL